jgi:hypothetical protein
VTKFQIFAPNGAKACVIEAAAKVHMPNNTICFFSEVKENYTSAKTWTSPIAEIPEGWAAIPVDVIVKEGH